MHAVVSENWVAYQYLRLQGHRQQLSVAELYDAGAHNLTVQEVLWGGGHNASDERSASDRTPIQVRGYMKYTFKGQWLELFLVS